MPSFKTVNGTDPEYLKQYFTLKDHVYETKTVMSLVPKFKTIKFGKRSLSYERASLWDTLGSRFKLSESLSDVRCQILTWDEPSCQYQSCVLCTVNRL